MASDKEIALGTIESVAPLDAQRAYSCCKFIDPEGKATPQSVALAGQSFRLQTKTGSLVYTVSMFDRELWIDGAVGAGRGMTRAGLIVIEAMAASWGCQSVGFQTARRGLIKLAKLAGYEAWHPIGTGLILKKKITCC